MEAIRQELKARGNYKTTIGQRWTTVGQLYENYRKLLGSYVETIRIQWEHYKNMTGNYRTTMGQL